MAHHANILTMNYEYPDDETLTRLAAWEMEKASELPQAMAEAWNTVYGQVEETRPGLWTFVTGGWSGNEDILSSVKSSKAWVILYWDTLQISGGLMVIAVTKEAKQIMSQERKRITTWAWEKHDEN